MTASDPRSVFERHPILTLGLVIVLAAFFLDLASARLYLAFKGHRWAEKADLQVVQVKRQYRTRLDPYDHGLAINYTGDEALWGPLRYRFRTNSLGMRDQTARDVPLAPKDYRVVLMGDSFTEGSGSPWEDIVAGRLETALTGEGIEILNAAVGTYSPIIYWRRTKYLLEEEGLRFHEMVVFLDISDVQDEAEFYELDDDGRVVRQSDWPDYFAQRSLVRESWRRLRVSMQKRTILTAYVLNWLASLQPAKPTTGLVRALWTVDEKLFEEYGQRGIERMVLYMDRLHELLEHYGVRLTVAVYPWPDQIVTRDLRSRHVRVWHDWCRGRCVSFIDYFPRFMDREASEVLDAYFIRGDVHWNNRGYEVVADGFLAEAGEELKQRAARWRLAETTEAGDSRVR
jgi:hypothetical protein